MDNETIIKNLKAVLHNVEMACKQRTPEVAAICPKPRFVAVAKTKPKEVILAAYMAGQHHFGENYVEELFEKSNNEQILKDCPDIKWHLIGPVQSKKVAKILKIPNLFIVETIHNGKIADAFQSRLQKEGRHMNIFIQVNTSGETAKSGCIPEETLELYKYITTQCSHLKVLGLMTIGIYDYDLKLGPNPDFQVLKKCREDICNACNLQLSELELSMGMSTDYEHAIEEGSTNVRVGSSVFGRREPKTH